MEDSLKIRDFKFVGPLYFYLVINITYNMYNTINEILISADKTRRLLLNHNNLTDPHGHSSHGSYGS